MPEVGENPLSSLKPMVARYFGLEQCWTQQDYYSKNIDQSQMSDVEMTDINVSNTS